MLIFTRLEVDGMYDIELVKKIVKFIPNEGLISIYKNKHINKLGVKCSRIEEVRENRGNLILNLFKPINKRHFEKWLFSFYKSKSNEEIKSQNSKEIDAPSEKTDVVETQVDTEKQKHLTFYNLVKLMYEGDLEKLEQQLIELETEEKSASEKLLNNDAREIKNEEGIKKELERVVKKLSQKIDDLNKELLLKNEQFNKRTENYENEIKRLRKINKDYQKEIQNNTVENKELSNKYNESLKSVLDRDKKIEGLQFEIEKLNNINDLNSLEIEKLKNIIDMQNEEFKKINQKEILVVGDFNLSDFDKLNFNFKFVGVEEIAELNSTEKDIWIIKYSLTPKEIYGLEIINLNEKTTGNLIEINAYSELIETINGVFVNVK